MKTEKQIRDYMQFIIKNSFYEQNQQEHNYNNGYLNALKWVLESEQE